MYNLGVDHEVWGKFLLEDYILKNTITYNTEISDENVYTSAIVIGKMSEKITML